MSVIFLSNIFKGIMQRFKKLALNPYNKFGINIIKVKVLKNKAFSELQSAHFLGSRIFFYNSIEFLYGVKEIFLNKIYKIELPDNALIYDCGSHIGLSIIYFKKNHPNSQLIAFEPDPKNFDLLSKNVAAFKFTNVILKNEAVWIEDTKLKFKTQGNMSSRIELLEEHFDEAIIIKAIRLKNHITKKIDFLKLDIEGAEYKVIKDIEDKLTFVQNIFIEYHGSFNENENLTEILHILNDNKFYYYIKEATEIYQTPFYRKINNKHAYDVQLNIFGFKN